MKQTDIRFDEKTVAVLQKMVGQYFHKLRHDPFIYAETVYQNVGLYIGNGTYSLVNELETMDYYGEMEDVAILTLKPCKEDEITSGLENTEQIDDVVEDIITEIRIVNENQQLFENGKQTYDVWLTRGIIFVCGEREIALEKDIWFSEEIAISKGYDTIKQFSDPKKFTEDWPNRKTANCSREIITLK